MTEEEAKKRMLEYNGKCDYCEFKNQKCKDNACPTDEDTIKKIIEVENEKSVFSILRNL